MEEKSDSGSVSSQRSHDSDEPRMIGHKRSGSLSERRKSRDIGPRSGSFTQNTLGQLDSGSLGQASQPHNMLKKAIANIDAILHGHTLAKENVEENFWRKTLK